MSNLLKLVDKLRGSGVHLAVDGDRLRYRAPKGVLNDDLKQRLATHKAEIIRLLQSEITHRTGPPYPDGLSHAKCFYCENCEITGTNALCGVSKKSMLGIALLKRCEHFAMRTVH